MMTKKSDRYIEKLEEENEKLRSELSETHLYQDIVENVLEYLIRKAEQNEPKRTIDGDYLPAKTKQNVAKVEAYREVINIIKRKLMEE